MRRPPEGRRRGDQKEEEFRHGKTAGNISPKREKENVYPTYHGKRSFPLNQTKRKKKRETKMFFFSLSSRLIVYAV